jgi:sugar/nucleoside kinase (ribokinase family)
LGTLLAPGKLVDVGPAVVATGGSVSNTGLALHRLGVPVSLMGKVGDDLFGGAILEVLRRHDPALAAGMIVEPGEQSSYTVVISPPGVDRVFLHCPGANDTFCAADVHDSALNGARLFHFGYPPLMRRMYCDGGAELASLLSRVKTRGLATSLDMARPDPASPAGKVDWPAILAKALPHVDFFLPSVDEMLFMLDRRAFDAFAADAAVCDGAMLSKLSARLLEMGTAVVVLKLGDQGCYVRTTADEKRLPALCGGHGQDARATHGRDAHATRGRDAHATTTAWLGRELLAPCFQVGVVGTTGSGDCTIAGFLAGVIHGLSVEDALTAAVGVGACNVEAADSTSGVPHWDAVLRRIAEGWPRRPLTMNLPHWRPGPHGLWIGPNDKTATAK